MNEGRLDVYSTNSVTALTLAPIDGDDLLLTTATGEELRLELVPLR